MLMPPSTRPHLHVRRPSPTTAEFIVSSHPPPSLRLRALLALLLATRLLLAAACLFFLYLDVFPVAKDKIDGAEAACLGSPPLDLFFNQSSGYDHHHHHRHHHVRQEAENTDAFAFQSRTLQFIKRTHSLVHAIVLSNATTRSLARLAPTVPPLLAIAAAYAAVWLATLRVRTSESLLVLRGLGIQVQGRFIPTAKILDVLINEAFLGFEVRYYLVVVVDGEDDLVVVFPTLLPGRTVVEAVWKGVRGCLWEEDLVRPSNVDEM